MFHLLHIKQIDIKSVHLSHEFTLCVQITLERVDAIGDPVVSFLADTEFQTCDLPAQLFFSWLHFVGPITVASSLGYHCLEHIPYFPVASTP